MSAFAHPPARALRSGPSLRQARSATAKYHSLTVAKKAGYSILADTAGITCIADPHMGAMGVHYVKGDLVKDPAIDATHPKPWSMHPTDMASSTWPPLEYVVIKADWEAKPTTAIKLRREPVYSGAADALRTHVQLHRRTQPIRSATLLFAARVGLEKQPCRHLRDVEPQRAL